MAGLWYRAGTIAVTNGSKKVVGTGTTWKSGVSKPDKGHLVWGPDGKPYELDYVESDTILYLVTAYSGVTASGMAYSIDITRTGAIPAFSRELSALVAYHQLQMDGWQQLLTGTGDVTLTAPDGSKLTVPTWDKVMNAGAGVVAQAKTEADRAKSEAANSAASAASAGNAVVAAALPLPDVWAPLSDSLRMITGYGREVKVGDDVVARMVNFSRSTTRTYTAKDGTLKIAAINEPCFEKEGLHLDVQSTNLIPSFPLTGSSVTIQKVTHPSLAIPAYRLTVAPGAIGLVSTTTIKDVGAYTLSLWSILESGTPTKFQLQNIYKDPAGVIQAAVVSLSQSSLERRSVTCQNTSSEARGNHIFIDNSGGSSPCVVLVAGWQLEALPWASSYIPTDGAAVTRAGDFLQFIGPGNHPDIRPGVPFTFAMRMSCEEAAPDRYRSVLVCPNIIRYSLLRRSGSSISYHRGETGQLSLSAPGRKMNVIAVKVTAENSCTLRVGASQATRTDVPMVSGKVTTVDIADVGGHVRDFRIWQHALTDEQIKAIA